MAYLESFKPLTNKLHKLYVIGTYISYTDNDATI